MTNFELVPQENKKADTKSAFSNFNTITLLSLGKFNYRDAALGASRSNTRVLRGQATTRCALELDLTTLKITCFQSLHRQSRSKIPE